MTAWRGQDDGGGGSKLLGRLPRTAVALPHSRIQTARCLRRMCYYVRTGCTFILSQRRRGWEAAGGTGGPGRTS